MRSGAAGPLPARPEGRLRAMMQSQLSAAKRWGKPLLFSAVGAGMVAAFLYRQRFFPDIEEIRARERNKHNERLQVILERREKQLLELDEKKARPDELGKGE